LVKVGKNYGQKSRTKEELTKVKPGKDKKNVNTELVRRKLMKG
jgi:hypothetical protein